MESLNFTIINHDARNKFGLTWIEYGLCDLVYNLSNNPASENRWCYASKNTLANMLGISKQYVHKIIIKIIKLGLIERHSQTKYLKTTQLWFDTVIIKNTKDSKQSLLPVNKVYSDSKQSLLHEIYYKDNNNDTPPTPLGKKSKDFLSVFINSFNEKFKTNFQETDGRKKKLMLRRKKFTENQLIEAISNLSQSSWHTGGNDRGWRADPDFLLRSDEQIDKWLNPSKKKSVLDEKWSLSG